MTKVKKPKEPKIKLPRQPTKTQAGLLNTIRARGGVVYIQKDSLFKDSYYLDNNKQISDDSIKRLLARGWLKNNNDGLLDGVSQTLSIAL